MKCGEKWSKAHKCPEKIALHVLEEFLEAVQADQPVDISSDESSEEEEEVFSLGPFTPVPLKKDGIIVNAPTKLGLSLSSLGLETSFAQAIPSPLRLFFAVWEA